MEATLVIVSLLSLAIAIGMAIVTWRLLQEQRQRADARVALLEEGLAVSIAANPLPAGPSAFAFEPETAPSVPIFTALAADDPIDASEQDSFAADRLFARTDATATSTTRSRGVFALGVAVVVIALILALWSVGRLIAPGVDQRGANGVAPPPTTPASAGVEPAPLELVALQQTRESDTLTIQGVVRNPAAGATTDRLAAVIAFFDVNGQQLASVRAPLDFRTLAPGDESPFRVTTTVPDGVTRYRVSFRRDEGTIVPHVDRRQQEAS